MTLFEQLEALTTEAVNPATTDIDLLSAREIVGLINDADKTVADAVELVLDAVSRVIGMAEDVVRTGGGILYVGAGTSGRLGILDAAEMPPTFGTHSDLIRGIIAGGDPAVFRSIEGAEDSSANGEQSVLDYIKSFQDFENSEMLGLEKSEYPGLGNYRFLAIGLSASGRTPFVLGALHKAHELGMSTVLVCTNNEASARGFAPFVDELICAVVGPEVVAGSTRMKSATAQKMIINMITTATMIRLGKTYGNVMVDLQLSNNKLRERARRIVMMICDVRYDAACSLLEQAGNHVKTALVMGLCRCSRPEADERLLNSHGFVRKALY
ncbi:MAG: N-acetylmuramic acid 6-phosphate etherase [Ignavibacteria bacterium]|nr:N-acetylmuramic acid 6-phosphate etherase [Ignavibacteria bacterium]